MDESKRLWQKEHDAEMLANNSSFEISQSVLKEVSCEISSFEISQCSALSMKGQRQVKGQDSNQLDGVVATYKCTGNRVNVGGERKILLNFWVNGQKSR